MSQYLTLEEVRAMPALSQAEWLHLRFRFCSWLQLTSGAQVHPLLTHEDPVRELGETP